MMDMRFYSPKAKDGKILAFADVTLADGMIVKGFRVVDGDNGRFAAVPSRSFMVDGTPRFVNQVAFTTADFRESFLRELLDGYELWKVNGGSNDVTPF